MGKSNKVEIDKRILEVSQMLLSGNSTKNICYYALLNWNISESQIKRYIRHCYTLWHEEFKKKSKANLNYQLAKRKDLYHKAYEAKDWKMCLSIAKDESKIMDLYPSDKHELQDEKVSNSEECVSKLDKLFTQLTVEEIRKIIILYDRVLKDLSGEELEELSRDIMFKKDREKPKLIEG